ncbi:MAG: efflux RND transporter permease subunit, partial [Acidobacteriota bacterium]
MSVVYPGATPLEVEEAICLRLEQRLQDLEVLDQMDSVASEGLGVVRIEFLRGTEMGQALDEVKTRVDAIDTFPEEAERPVVQKDSLRYQVLSLAISGNADERTLKRLGEQVRDDITALDGITQVDLEASRPDEISIEVSEASLRRFGLTFDQVARAVARSSLDLPGGSIWTESGEILIRTKGQAYRRRAFEAIEVVA